MRKERFRDFYEMLRADLDSVGPADGDTLNGTSFDRLLYMLSVVKESGKVFNGEQIETLTELSIYGGTL